MSRTSKYQVAHGFLTPELGSEVVTISRLVSAFFRWEFNSCETIVKGDDAAPIDYANACPDVALTSLRYYFPWAITALARWSLFCLASGRRMQVDQDLRPYFEIGDRDDLSYEEKLLRYRELADEYFQTDEYAAFCAEALPHAEGSCSSSSRARGSTSCLLPRSSRPSRPMSMSSS